MGYYPATGRIHGNTGVRESAGVTGFDWSSSRPTEAAYPLLLEFTATTLAPAGNRSRAYGHAVRCLHSQK